MDEDVLILRLDHVDAVVAHLEDDVEDVDGVVDHHLMQNHVKGDEDASATSSGAVDKNSEIKKTNTKM